MKDTDASFVPVFDCWIARKIKLLYYILED